MSLTNRDCSECGDEIFADDEHSCFEEGMAITEEAKFPSGPHWVILLFYKSFLTEGNDVARYLAFLTEDGWKEEIAVFTKRGELEPFPFVAFKATGPARISSNYTVDVDL